MALYGVCFESHLIKLISTNMAWRWFCGFSVLAPVPTAATLCNFRKRLGVERFEKILNWLIRQCYEAGLITLEEAYFDFTGVKASATQLTPYQRVVVLAKALSAYLAGLDDHSIAEDEELASVLRRLIIEVAQDVLSEKHSSVEDLSVEQLARSLDRLDEQVEEMPQGPRWWHRIQQTLRRWWQRAKGGAQEGSDLLNRLSTTTAGTSQREQALDVLRDHLHDVGEVLIPTIPHAWGDLSARVGTLSRGVTICGYQVGYLVDGAHDVIIGVVSMAANALGPWAQGPGAAQAPRVKQVLGQAKRLVLWAVTTGRTLGSLPQRLGLDSAFDQDQVYLDLEGEDVEAFAAVSPVGRNHRVSRDHRSPKGRFGPDRFLFNEDGILCCPAGTPMEQKYGPYDDGRVVHEGRGCADYPLPSQCVSEDEEARRFSTRRLVLWAVPQGRKAIGVGWRIGIGARVRRASGY
jgi:IS5 family transposase